jgi:carboxypeptidase T
MSVKLFKVWLWIVLLGGLTIVRAQNQPYAGIRIEAVPADYQRLAAAGILPDHFHPESHTSFVVEYSAWEQATLQQLGIPHTVLWKDAANRYVAQNQAALATEGGKTHTAVLPPGFNLGSMGGYLTYDELVRELDSMRFNHPNLISQKFSIGTSIEGRDIWAVRISDHPDLDESEPEVMYSALHHAREPISLMQMVYFMDYLFARYASDSIVHYLLDNRELYFVPVVNPDGYVYNQSTNPQGGGMWRKNRRFNGNGSYGVDINRNYGFEWGYDTLGSSSNPNSNTYRGLWAFSEPETRAMRDFCVQRNFRLSQNGHSYGNYIVHPWGYQRPAPAVDAALFHDFGMLMTRKNGYTVGTNYETVGYLANGTSDDWMYGDQAVKAKIYAFSPEESQATDGFWPPSTAIPDLCEELIDQNLVTAWLAGDCVIPMPRSGHEFDGPVAHLKVDFRNFGLMASQPFFAEYQSTDSYIQQVLIPGMNLPMMATTVTRTDSFAIQMSPLTPKGHRVRGLVRTHLHGGIVLEDSLNFIYGLPETLFEDDGEAAVSNQWSGGWALTAEKAYSGLQSYTDSPWNDYGLGIVSNVTTTLPVNLTDYSGALLRFAAAWQLQRGFDFVQVSASTDGVNFLPLKGIHSRLGAGTMQPSGAPLYDGTAPEWVMETIDLNAYAGQQVYFRFEIQTDAWGVRDGFYFDDVSVTGYRVPTNRPDPFGFQGMLQPNPAHGWAKVRLSDDFSSNSSIRLTNVLGQQLLKMPVVSGSMIDLSALAPGVYWYHFVSDAAETAPQKLVIR